MKTFISNVTNYENFDETAVSNCESVGYLATFVTETDTVTHCDEKIQVTNCLLTIGELSESAQYTTYAGELPTLVNILEKIGFHNVNGATYYLSLYEKSQQQALLHVEESLRKYGWFINLSKIESFR
ncbi:MAG: hypothetical protein COX30_03875 [Candidatus Moranbacteria bacterium CG23_combo_of_CG06-09_8_20_14_all_39_10]|nr:MAG: hypothetical protein COX30_03875 [Candidatus Moranbacteria bacterium CG23_combo_of_CG06-09_8_20_14_all_39_10]